MPENRGYKICTIYANFVTNKAVEYEKLQNDVEDVEKFDEEVEIFDKSSIVSAEFEAQKLATRRVSLEKSIKN